MVHGTWHMAHGTYKAYKHRLIITLIQTNNDNSIIMQPEQYSNKVNIYRNQLHITENILISYISIHGINSYGMVNRVI